MINIIKVNAIFDFSTKDFYKKNLALVFDEKVIEISAFNKAIYKYKNANILDYSEYNLCPVFCNIHSHLEFCTSLLDYGDFILWLKSIIKNRSKINKEELNKNIKENLLIMLKSGVGYLGEISSFAAQLEELEKSPIKAIIFHEILGANKEVASKNIDFFLQRFYTNTKHKNSISLHSPYSVCDKVYDFALSFAKQNDLLISTHYLESKYEKAYLNNKKNALYKYLNANFKASALSKDFLKGFKNLKALFTHCNYVDDFSIFNKNHYLTHCLRSNTYLNSRLFNMQKALKDKITLSLGTDGLSSNDSLNFFDELRANLLIHGQKMPLKDLAYELFKAACFNLAPLFLDGLNALSVNAKADFILLKNYNYDKEQILIQTILRTKEVKNIFLDGKKII